jgi:thiosulfate/3-mercaptopyruvate sulfurtransferase
MTISGPTLTSPLVSTQWLADHLGADKLVVLDATVLASSEPHGGYLSGDEQYLVHGHIPGAYFADLLRVFSDPDGRFPFTRPDARAFEEAAGSAGIDNDTTVIVYDSAVGQWASRIWWLFRAVGYDQVAVLDGGFTKWIQDGRETELGHQEPTPATFTASERPELWVDKTYVERIVSGEEHAALVCGIPPKEFTGEAAPRPRAGHIPGSISVPAGQLVDRGTRTVVATEELRARFAPALGGQRIVTYCGSGIAAAADALALTLLGERNVAIYDGSLNEWTADPDAPIVVGA